MRIAWQGGCLRCKPVGESDVLSRLLFWQPHFPWCPCLHCLSRLSPVVEGASSASHCCDNLDHDEDCSKKRRDKQRISPQGPCLVSTVGKEVLTLLHHLTTLAQTLAHGIIAQVSGYSLPHHLSISSKWSLIPVLLFI